MTVVFNDNAFGNVKRIQQETFDGRTIASDLHNPDFVKLAESFGMAGMRATDPKELEKTLDKALAMNAPVLIEVPVERDAQPVVADVGPLAAALRDRAATLRPLVRSPRPLSIAWRGVPRCKCRGVPDMPCSQAGRSPFHLGKGVGGLG